mmetsp:Transcript_70151/g.183864  ORF Transcript_70151/g.183864 Transcript_70151/m.183864 type:complete len:221 (+) Transcript_70151:131-793(+)
MFSGLLFGGCTPQSCSTPVNCAGCDAPERGCDGPCQPTVEYALYSESQVPPLVPARKDGARLTVPAIFSRFQFSVIYTQLGATQGTLMEQQRSMLQSILKHFSKEMSKGVVISVMDHNGRAVEYLCSLDRDMTQISMAQVDGTPAKALVFRDIERICSPEEVRNLRATNVLVLDECCTTVVLTGQRFVTFRLESVPQREYLMLSLQVLRMSQDKARMWYP